jgi:4-hydroxybenzoate polyprenyltransferase
MPSGFRKKLQLRLETIRFEHSIFGLPFALTGAMLALRDSGYTRVEAGWKLFWIVVAMAAACSAAMAFNRILDSAIDASNPRMRCRRLSAGLPSKACAWGFTAASATVFLMAARMLSTLCFWLAPVAILMVFLYAFTKRFTTFSRLLVGFALAIAPAAAWIAIRGSLDQRILWLTAAVTLWTAGFDIIYACPDCDFDRSEGLFSIPARFGLRNALWISRAFHFGTVVCLAALLRGFGLGGLSIAGVAIVAALLVYEQSMVKPDDLSRVNLTLFTLNGYVSVLFFLLWAADILLLRPSS